MSGFDQTMVLMRYFMNNCCFDRSGKPHCNPEHKENEQRGVDS
jgi:hypothetical protein